MTSTTTKRNLLPSQPATLPADWLSSNGVVCSVFSGISLSFLISRPSHLASLLAVLLRGRHTRARTHTHAAYTEREVLNSICLSCRELNLRGVSRAPAAVAASTLLFMPSDASVSASTSSSQPWLHPPPTQLVRFFSSNQFFSFIFISLYIHKQIFPTNPPQKNSPGKHVIEAEVHFLYTCETYRTIHEKCSFLKHLTQTTEEVLSQRNKDYIITEARRVAEAGKIRSEAILVDTS